jgi:hypothetical protein
MGKAPYQHNSGAVLVRGSDDQGSEWLTSILWVLGVFSLGIKRTRRGDISVYFRCPECLQFHFSALYMPSYRGAHAQEH